MSHRLIATLWVCVLGLCGVIVTPAPASAQPLSDEDATSSPVLPSYGDGQLIALLDATDLTDAWLSSANVSNAAALVEVIAGPGAGEVRSTFLDELRILGERRALVERRMGDIARIEADTGNLQLLLRDLRRSVAVAGGPETASLTQAKLTALRAELEGIDGSRRWMGISLDPLVLAEHHLVSVRDEVLKVLDGFDRSVGNGKQTDESAVEEVTILHADLERVQSLIDRAQQDSVRNQLVLASHRATVVALMPELHRQRLLSSSAAGGLPLVTLDAYISGAETLDPSCPVDWNLLAGIGRVESFHGTIGDSTVQASGRVSNPILGPLLDGGATEREAAEAAARAEAERLAELEAEETATEPTPEPEEAFDAELWGDDTLTRAKETREQASGSSVAEEPVPAAEPTEGRTPRYDPLLWGDDLPFDEDDLPPADADEDGDEDEDVEEPRFRGNGFAVIHDTDNGALDGNSRWDRAVGPMQFIPETWSYWATDGNGDGVTDPQNLYDAAASAGQFLCHLSRSRGSSPYRFVLGYNASDVYVRNVMAFADAFGATALPEIVAN